MATKVAINGFGRIGRCVLRAMLARRENIEVVIQTAERLSEVKIGALIALEQSIQLDDVVESGVLVDCEATPEMLETIFFPNNAIHDGGVILRRDRIALLPRDEIGVRRLLPAERDLIASCLIAIEQQIPHDDAEARSGRNIADVVTALALSRNSRTRQLVASSICPATGMSQYSARGRHSSR